MSLEERENGLPAQPNANAPAPRPAPRYSLAALAAPVLGVLAVIVFVGMTGSQYWKWHGPIVVAILAFSTVVGLVLGWIAWKRDERLRAITILGFLINAPLPLWLLWNAWADLRLWLNDY